MSTDDKKSRNRVRQREIQAKKQMERDAPKFRDYIRLLLENIDDEDWDYHKEKKNEYMKKWIDKNKEYYKDYQKEYRKNQKNTDTK